MSSICCSSSCWEPPTGLVCVGPRASSWFHRGWIYGGKRSPHGEEQLIIFYPIFPVAQSLHCAVSKVLRLEDDPSRTFNWTSKPGKVEKCSPGELCQETVLLIKAGRVGSSFTDSPCWVTAVQLHRVTFITNVETLWQCRWGLER